MAMRFQLIALICIYVVTSCVLCSTLPPVTDVKKCECDSRYFQHYLTKNCTPIYDDLASCKCPKRFECKTLSVDPKICVLNGKSYPLGSKVNSTNNCQFCDCREDFLTGKASIQCITSECGLGFRRPTEGCYLYYEEDKCCPSEKCEPDIKGTTKPEVCSYNGKDYKLGQKIYPEEDPCLICLCTQKWSGVNNQSCKIYNCELEKNIHRLVNNCIPIYNDKSCCPIEYHCPNTSETILPDKDADKCYFEGRSYGIGEELNIKHPTNCVTCTCQVPPEFTCIHRSCAGPPNNDYENCRYTYKPNTCCAEYNCTKEETKAPVDCPPVDCATPLCQEIPLPNGCSKCECRPLCSPPKCTDGCSIQTEVPEGQCPGCDCP